MYTAGKGQRGKSIDKGEGICELFLCRMCCRKSVEASQSQRAAQPPSHTNRYMSLAVYPSEGCILDISIVGVEESHHSRDLVAEQQQILGSETTS